MALINYVYIRFFILDCTVRKFDVTKCAVKLLRWVYMKVILGMCMVHVLSRSVYAIYQINNLKFMEDIVVICIVVEWED